MAYDSVTQLFHHSLDRSSPSPVFHLLPEHTNQLVGVIRPIARNPLAAMCISYGIRGLQPAWQTFVLKGRDTNMWQKVHPFDSVFDLQVFRALRETPRLE